MELSDRVIRVVESMKGLDEDSKQDLYVKWLEQDGTLMNKSDSDIRNMASIYAWHLSSNKEHVERNRRRLEDENAETIQNMFNMNDFEPDLMDVFIADEEFERKLKLLSPLLEGTLELMNQGYTSAELAEHYGVTENTIYQRIWQAKTILEGE